MNANQSSCQIDDTELLAYRDGELVPARQTVLASHVEQCLVCQARLAEAARLSETLLAGSPLRDQPVARAAIHQRIAGERTSWWRQRVVIGAVLPAVAVLLLVIGVNRWLENDRCDSCPPLPVSGQMQITATSGLPAGWGALLPCPAASAPHRSLAQTNVKANVAAGRPLAAPVAAPELGLDAKRILAASKATTLRERPGRTAVLLAERQAATSGAGCALGNLTTLSGLGDGAALGATTGWSNPPGS